MVCRQCVLIYALKSTLFNAGSAAAQAWLRLASAAFGGASALRPMSADFRRNQ
jgi:hypothetical protein